MAAGTHTGPAPEPTGDGGAAAHLHGPTQLFANVVALPTPSSPTATDQATLNDAHPDPDHHERSHHEPGDNQLTTDSTAGEAS